MSDEPMKKSDYTPEHIRELALTEPIVANCYAAWQKGWINWEQMLIGCIHILVEHNKTLTKLAEDAINNRSAPWVIKQDR